MKRFAYLFLVLGMCGIAFGFVSCRCRTREEREWDDWSAKYYGGSEGGGYERDFLTLERGAVGVFAGMAAFALALYFFEAEKSRRPASAAERPPQ